MKIIRDSLELSIKIYGMLTNAFASVLILISSENQEGGIKMFKRKAPKVYVASSNLKGVIPHSRRDATVVKGIRTNGRV
jgi:hypothetical protein